MEVIIQPSAIKGTASAPSSKSAMQRACALALLHPGVTTIYNPGNSLDDLAALAIIDQLGAEIKYKKKSIEISGAPSPGSRAQVIDCGESGLSMRMFTPIAAIADHPITITGKGSLLKRPMDGFNKFLPQLGVDLKSLGGQLPLQVKGPLKPADILIDGSLSSQFLTGLLIAFGKTVMEPVSIKVDNLKSRPYIDLTLQMMKHFGYNVDNDRYKSFTVYPVTPASKQAISYTVEGDWSSSAFLLVAAAICGEITLSGLDVYSAQADKAILQALISAKVNVSISPERVIVKAKPLEPFHFNATDCPDLFPPLVALAAYCKGMSVIEGVSRLAFKESNRALTLQQEFEKMGVHIRIQDDLMIIEGGEDLNDSEVFSHDDHRIAMALSVAALGASGETKLISAEAINKSYPAFFNQLKQLGAIVNIPSS